MGYPACSAWGLYLAFKIQLYQKARYVRKKLYEDISEGRERLELEYYSTVYSNLEGRKDYAGEMAEEYLSCLQNNLDDDIRAGFTQKGVHRDDLAGK